MVSIYIIKSHFTLKMYNFTPTKFHICFSGCISDDIDGHTSVNDITLSEFSYVYLPDA
jgi:hypothetical protein